MRTLIHAALLAGLLAPVAGAVSAADLDHPYYEPAPPVRVLPPPPRPFCGPYRPCFRPWRFGFYGPRWGRPVPPADVGPEPYGPRPYAERGRPEGYGYDYDRERFERAHEHFSRYGYVRPDPRGREPYGEPYRGPRRDYGPRDRGERYGEGRPPYADPLGHDGRHEGYRGGPRGDDRDERGPGPEGRDPYGRG